MGESTDTLDPQEVTEKTIIAAMDESGVCRILKKFAIES